jgi:hypothetical protein
MIEPTWAISALRRSSASFEDIAGYYSSKSG